MASMEVGERDLVGIAGGESLGESKAHADSSLEKASQMIEPTRNLTRPWTKTSWLRDKAWARRHFGQGDRGGL